MRSESEPQPNSVKSCPGEFINANGGNLVPPGVARGTSEFGLMDRARRVAEAEVPAVAAAAALGSVPENDLSNGLGSASSK